VLTRVVPAGTEAAAADAGLAVVGAFPETVGPNFLPNPGFAGNREGGTRVKDRAGSVKTPEGVHFIDENAVREQVLAHTSAVVGSAIGDVDLVGIEHLDCRQLASPVQPKPPALVDGRQRSRVGRVQSRQSRNDSPPCRWTQPGE